METKTKLMKAMRIDRFGGPEVMHPVEIATPQPIENEVLLRVRASSVNPVDWKIRSGKYPEVKADMLPYTLGRDVSGDVIACGPGSSFDEGAALYAFLGIDRGAFAQYVIVHESEASLKPAAIDYTSAAAVPLAGLTAWQGLFRHGALRAGQHVLIHGGSGGVGHFAVQFAKAMGARVTTTVATKNVELARQFGADEVIDYKTQKFENETRDVDVVFDLIGGDTQERSWSVLKKGGILISTIAEPPQAIARAHCVRGTRYTAKPDATDLRDIAALIDAGKVRPLVSRTIPFLQAAAGMELVESGHTVGKVVLTQ
jgi:NADPH:quinone reductase-like Zn-dependent oxidoreductase